jgi:hypothetical protein
MINELKLRVNLPPGVRQTVKTQFAVRLKVIGWPNDSGGRCDLVGEAEAGHAGEQTAEE